MTIKTYLPIKEKIKMIEDIIDMALVNFEGKLEYRSMFEEIAKVYYITKYYSDFEFITKLEEDGATTEAITDNYDLLVSSGKYDEIIKQIPEKELKFIENQITVRAVEIELQIENENSFSEIIKKLLKDFSGNLPQMIESLKNVSPDNYKQIQEMMKFAKGE